VSLSLGSPLGNLGGGFRLLGILIVEGGLQKGNVCLCGSSVSGTWRAAPLLGIRREWGGGLRGQSSLTVGVLLGSLEGGSFTGDLCVEEGSGDGHLSPQGPC